jgi:hypothetical protein
MTAFDFDNSIYIINHRQLQQHSQSQTRSPNPNSNPKLITPPSNQTTMNTYSASPYPLLDGNNGADTPGAFFFRKKNKKPSPSTTQRSQSTCPSNYEPSIAPSDATTLVPDDNYRRDANFVRPTTPIQGSRGKPWSSYRDLPSGHPVFAYSEDVRTELYGKGIGELTVDFSHPGDSLANLMYATDPVVQAELEAAKQDRSSSADGKAKGFWKQSASRLKTFAAC